MEPETSYLVRLGVVPPSGEFAEAAASEMAATLAESPSGERYEQWLVLREEFDRLIQSVFLAAGGPLGVSSKGLVRLHENPRKLRLSSGSLMDFQPAVTAH